MKQVSLIFSLIASGLWFWSAMIEIPNISMPWGGEVKSNHPFLVALRDSARFNRAAAFFTGMSILFSIM